jgi:hypothetical protein
MKIHELKCWPAYFERLRNGTKTFEVRRNDRDYQTGDYLRIDEYIPPVGGILGFDQRTGHTGQIDFFRVTYILHGPEFGIQQGFCVMAVLPVERNEIEQIFGFQYPNEGM